MNIDHSQPVVSILPGRGFQVHFANDPKLTGTGATLPEALRALSATIAARYDTEKGDETAAARDAARQTDILEGDRFINGLKLQHSVLLGAALGLI